MLAQRIFQQRRRQQQFAERWHAPVAAVDVAFPARTLSGNGSTGEWFYDPQGKRPMRWPFLTTLRGRRFRIAGPAIRIEHGWISERTEARPDPGDEDYPMPEARLEIWCIDENGAEITDSGLMLRWVADMSGSEPYTETGWLEGEARGDSPGEGQFIPDIEENAGIEDVYGFAGALTVDSRSWATYRMTLQIPPRLRLVVVPDYTREAFPEFPPG